MHHLLVEWGGLHLKNWWGRQTLSMNYDIDGLGVRLGNKALKRGVDGVHILHDMWAHVTQVGHFGLRQADAYHNWRYKKLTDIGRDGLACFGFHRLSMGGFFLSCNASHVRLASCCLLMGVYFSNSSLPRRILLVYKEAQLENKCE